MTTHTKLVLVLVLVLALDQSASASEDDLARATQPLSEGIPEVAVVRLRVLLGAKLPEAERRTATLKLAEALAAAEQPAEALQLLDEARLTELPETTFLRAQAFAALSRWSEALPLYQRAANDAAHAQEARFGTAEALRALDRIDEALQTINSLTSDRVWGVRARFVAADLVITKGDLAGATRLVDSVQPSSIPQRKERRFLRGRIEWQAHHSQKAIAMFASVLKKPEGTPHPILVATLFAIADAHLELGNPGAGDDHLEDYIEHQPADPDLPAIFAKLDQLYAAERRPSRRELGRWSRDPAQPRRALAQWYLARAELRLGHRDVARQLFEQMRADHPPLPALADGFLQSAEMELQDGRPDQAATILETARSLRPAAPALERINFLAARAQYAARRFDRAAQDFRQIALGGGPHAKDAFVNASLAWLSAGDAGQTAAAAQELKRSGADEQTRAALALEEGLMNAARGEKNAAESLQKFIRDFPTDARVSEAWVALAELAFHAAPPRLDEARQDLARALEAKPTPGATERADYLGIWLEESGATVNEERIIQLATEFLQKHAASGLVPDVRLKLAETFYRRQDFASAQTQFELLAQQNPNGPLAEKAQFFAAASASRSMGKAALDRALSAFDEVVKRNGELKWAARNEQAVIERKLGKPQDAMTLYEEVLKGDARPAEKREAICGKGDILYELGTTDPENYRRAIAVYDQLAADREASAHWRNQALFKKGMCLEKLGSSAEALTAFYGIVEDESRPDRRREFFWFYKAGFNAARLLEEEAKWQSAAAIYDKLAFAGGARSEEARSRLNRLRLEHFLWEQ